MKYLFAIMLLGLLAIGLMGCKPPVTDVPTSKAFVVNSAWQVVLTADVEAGKGLGSKAVQSDIQGQVNAYNAAHTNDQQFLYMDQVPPIEDAPTCDIYIVVESTHVVAYQDLGVSRSDASSRRDIWELTAETWSGPMGEPCVLYVDNVPPAPDPVAPIDPYIKWAVYEIDTVTGAIIIEEHEIDADTFTVRKDGISAYCEGHNLSSPEENPLACIFGRLYAPPVGG